MKTSPINKITKRVFVINMDKDTDKLKNVSKELSQHNIKFTRVKGIDASKLDSYQIDNNVSKGCKYVCPRSAVGCGISHMSIWKKMVNENIETALILEDDVELVDDFNQRLSQVWKQVPEDWEMVLLGCAANSCGNPKKDDFQMYPYRLLLFNKKDQQISKNVMVPNGILGTHAYIIRRSYAIKMLEEFDDKVYYHIDIQITRSKCFKNGRIYSIIPNLVYQNSVTIGVSDNMMDRPYFLNYMKHKTIDNKQHDTTQACPMYILKAKMLRIGMFSITLMTILYFMLGLVFGKLAYAVYGFLGIMLTDSLFNGTLIKDIPEILFDTSRFYFGWMLVG